jgi:potassium large conductance calcium-activated channel subfamily M alpha member 1
MLRSLNLVYLLYLRICFTKLKILLIAIELANEDESGSCLCINPDNRKYIEFGTRGFFIAGSAEEARRAYYFCETCHTNIVNLEQIKKCKCHLSKQEAMSIK